MVSIEARQPALLINDSRFAHRDVVIDDEDDWRNVGRLRLVNRTLSELRDPMATALIGMRSIIISASA